MWQEPHFTAAPRQTSVVTASPPLKARTDGVGGVFPLQRVSPAVLGKELKTDPGSLPHLGLRFLHQTMHNPEQAGDFQNTGSRSASRPTEGEPQSGVQGLFILLSDKSEKLESN